MDTQIQISPPAALERLSRVLGDYKRVRGQTDARVLERAGFNLSLRLNKEFSTEAPKNRDITQAARDRGWRMGRNDTAGGSEATGISAEAVQRAKTKLQGYRSILAIVSTEDNRVRVSPITYGRRGRIRTGRRKSGPGRYDFAISGARNDLEASVAAGARRMGAKRLNFRALATIEEINLRESGRRFMAVSWMHKRWRRLSQKASREMGVSRVLQNVNPRSQLKVLGEMRMESLPANAGASLTLSSRVPGVHAVGRSRGLFTKAINFVSDDMAAFALQEETKALAGELSASLRA